MKTLPRYLYIDLDTGESRPYPITESYFRTYLGGKTLAARIMLDETAAGLDALSAENLLIVNTGPLTGTGAPSSGRFNVTTKNVLTGGIATSNCGGNFGVKLRRAGLDGIIIRGRASAPVYIEITGAKATIHCAQKLWGLDTEATQEQLPKQYGKIVIGPAGENQVSYASIVSQERVAGRCGVGAVMGSKNLKAVIAHGSEPVPIAQPERFRALNKKWIEMVRTNKYTGEALPRYGTMGFMSKGSALGLVPVENFSQEASEQVNTVTGEHYAETLLTKNYGCVSCSIRCGRRQLLAGKDIKGPEYETVGLLGPNLGIYSLEQIAAWNYQADLLGLDTISLGGTLGFAMELKQKGLADFGLEFGKGENISQTIEAIAHRRGQGAELARGSRWLAAKYGGSEFAVQSRGMELAAYDPRRSVGLGLGYATSNRGACHLNGGYMVFLEALGPLNIDPQTPKAKAALTVLMQNLMEAVSASGMCIFTSMASFPGLLNQLKPTGLVMRTLSGVMKHSGPVVGFLDRHNGIAKINTAMVPYPKALASVTGIKMNLGEFLRQGDIGYNTERMFNVREGVAGSEDKLCQRLLETPQKPGQADTVVPLAEMLPQYYRLRGWDAQGVPTAKKLNALGVEIGQA